MDLALLLTALGLIVAIVIGIWQIYLAYKQVKQGESKEEHAGPSSMLLTQDPQPVTPNTSNLGNPYLSLFKQCASLDDLLERSIKEIEKISQTDYNQILLSVPHGHASRLVTVAYVIPSHKQRYEIATFDGLLGKSFMSGKIRNIPNVSIDSNYIPAVSETKSELVVPIKNEGAVIGIINSESEELAHYNSDICAHMEKIASALGEMLPVFGWLSSAATRLPKVYLSPSKGS